MIEKTVIDYLDAALQVPVGPIVPAGPPGSYCTVSKTNSDERDGLLAALISVRSVAPSIWGAMNLSKAVREAMAQLRDERSNVFSCRCETEYEDSKPKTMEYAYKAVFRVFYVERSQSNV